jgi:hypothetical protein
MTLVNPIFIVGSGRCGSTIVHQMFTHHPHVTYLSGACKLRPAVPAYNRLAMRLIDLPLLGRLVRRKLSPGEHWEFWDHYVRGFSAPFRDLRADDLRPNEKNRILKALEKMPTKKRSRLLVKLTGWPRTGFLSEIFSDALFIHVYRDGRAVANSLINAVFWGGWGGPDQWRWGPLSPESQQEWDRSDKSFIVLAGIQWKIMMDAFEEAKKRLPATQFMEVRYEEFAADPVAAFGEILKFCKLDYPDAYRDVIKRFEVDNRNYKWKEELSERQQSMLEACLHDHLDRYGYASKA